MNVDALIWLLAHRIREFLKGTLKAVLVNISFVEKVNWFPGVGVTSPYRTFFLWTWWELLRDTVIGPQRARGPEVVDQPPQPNSASNPSRSSMS